MAYIPVLAALLIVTPFTIGSRVDIGQHIASRDYAGAERPAGPDYSQVDSREKAQQLADKGELVPILLLPQIFGGDRRPQNVVFVPRSVAKLKQDVDEGVIKPMIADGKIRRYEATPVYSGSSFVPVALNIRAYDPASFSQRIAIWGQAIAR